MELATLIAEPGQIFILNTCGNAANAEKIAENYDFYIYMVTSHYFAEENEK
jgi:hypothetical protein